MTEREDSETIEEITTPPRGRRVHEHRRAGTRLSPRVACAGRSESLGVAAVSALWGDGDPEVGRLSATAVVLARAGDGAGAAAPVSWVWADVLGGVGAAGAWRVVRAGGETECDRPLAAPGGVDAPDGGGAAVLAGASGAVAGLATAGPGASGQAGVPSECEHGRAVAGSGGGDG